VSQQTIVVIDDSPEDLELTVRALRRAGYRGALDTFADADATLRHLERCPPSSLPSVALVDLNLPGMDGRTLIQIIRAQRALRELPVVAVSTSTDLRDAALCDRLGACAYIQKRLDLRAFEADVAALAPLWAPRVSEPWRA
jgi:CheY-like chemotaxis protein